MQNLANLAASRRLENDIADSSAAWHAQAGNLSS